MKEFAGFLVYSMQRVERGDQEETQQVAINPIIRTGQ